MKNYKIIIACLIMVFVLTACGQSSDKNNESTTINVGAITPLTGDAATYGLPVQRVINLAIAEINKDSDTQINLIWEDGKCNNKDAASATNKLVNLDKVKIILGGFCSSETLAAAPIVENNKVVLLSPGSSSPDITNAGDYIFRNYPSDSAQGILLAQESNKREYKKVAIISEQSDYALGIKNIYESTFTELGGEVLVETFLPDTTDFKAALTKMKNFEPDAIFITPQTPSKADAILAQMQDLNMNNKLIVNDVVFGTPELLSKYSELFEGSISAETGYDEEHEAFKNLMAKYLEQYGEEMPYKNYMATTYDSAYIIKDMLEAAGEDTDKMKEFLYAIKDRPGVAGSLTMDANGEPESGHMLKEIKNGEKVKL